MPNQNQWSVFKRLLTYLKPYKFLTFLALTFLLSTTVIKSIIPLVASYFIDHYLHDMNQAASMILIGYYGLYLLQTLVQYLGNLFFARVSNSIVRDIRRHAFANMEKLRPLARCSQEFCLVLFRLSLSLLPPFTP